MEVKSRELMLTVSENVKVNCGLPSKSNSKFSSSGSTESGTKILVILASVDAIGTIGTELVSLKALDVNVR